ncbi:MAG: hypothetical protein HC804_12840 [Anaerolineae bacterium]|nr:hypothetical protein [Anaerolineae bacterium]
MPKVSTRLNAFLDGRLSPTKNRAVINNLAPCDEYLQAADGYSHHFLWLPTWRLLPHGRAATYSAQIQESRIQFIFR